MEQDVLLIFGAGAGLLALGRLARASGSSAEGGAGRRALAGPTAARCDHVCASASWSWSPFIAPGDGVSVTESTRRPPASLAGQRRPSMFAGALSALDRTLSAAGWVLWHASVLGPLRIRCVIVGHADGLSRQTGRLALRCDACGRTTAGWAIGPPPATALQASVWHGDAAFHLRARHAALGAAVSAR